MNWERVRLGEVCKIYQPKTITQKEITKSGKYKVFGANGVIGYYDKYNHDFEEVAVTCRGATCGTVNMTEAQSWITGNAMVITPLNSDISKKYLFHYLKNYNMERVITGSAQPQITKINIENILFIIPPMSVQKEIVEKLDKAAAIREKSKALLAHYDALAESLFIELFGDPISNEKGWEKKKLGEVCVKIGSGATPRGGRESYLSEGISFIRSLNVYDREFKYKDLAFIDENQAYDLRNVIVEEGDVLFNITGSVCRSCVVPLNVLPARVSQHVMILRCKKEMHN